MRSSEGVVRSELERAWRGMEHGAAIEGVRRGMESTLDGEATRHEMGCGAGKTAATIARRSST